MNHDNITGVAASSCSWSPHFRRRVADDNPLVFYPRVNRLPVQPPSSPPPAREINPFLIRFLFEKQLKNSDVNAAGRIVIPKKFAETHLPPLNDKAGFWMHLDDMDFQQVWTFKFRFWPNNHGRIYIFENTKEFTRRYCLEHGDYIMVYKDDWAGLYLVRGRNRCSYVASAHEPYHQIGDNSPAGNINIFPTEEHLHYGNDYYQSRRNSGEEDMDMGTPISSDYAHLICSPCCQSLDDFGPKG